jgi:putative iron-regulated protein
MKKNWIGISIVAAALAFTACSKDDDTDNEVANNADNTEVTDTTTTSVSKEEVVENYANIVYASYEDSYNTAVTLQTAINTFTTTPNEANFEAAKKAWLDAREPYGQTEAYRFADGPIDDADGPEGLLNAWPLDENYVDYVTDANGNIVNGGIINNTEDYPSITSDLLESLNEKNGEANISIGYHAVEFLLWGQDSTDPSAKTKGTRSYTDYVVNNMELAAKSDVVSSVSNQTRRATYLKLCADQIVANLGSLKDEWATGGSYRKTFLALDEDVALKNILTGIGILSKSELAGERIFVAYDNQDQEDEHSCFSDNTHRDIILNAIGIQNVYNGTYTRVGGSTVSGTSISDLVKEQNETLNTEVVNSLKQSVTDAEAIPVPFDNAISDASERPSVLTSVKSLQSTGDKIAEAAKAISITINTELPE